MYAGGKNYWRVTPDTTDGMTKEAFLISKEGEDPTFSINGQTISFPGGEIIEDGFITEVGTCGYWVRTSTEMTMPTITYAQNRYSMAPSFLENFEEYALDMKFNGTTVTNKLTWNVFSAMGGACKVVEDPNNPNNLKLIETGCSAAFVPTTAEKFHSTVTLNIIDEDGEQIDKDFAYAKLALNTSISMSNLKVVKIYTTIK